MLPKRSASNSDTVPSNTIVKKIVSEKIKLTLTAITGIKDLKIQSE